jgi:hypothetical protein
MTTEKAKKILGKVGKKMTDQQIEELVNSIQYLIDYFLEMKETEIFGKPIRKLLES